MSLKNLAAEFGLESMVIELSCERLIVEVSLPSILLWHKNHYVVLYKIQDGQFFIANPALGNIVADHEYFINSWLNANQKGILLIFEMPELDSPNE